MQEPTISTTTAILNVNTEEFVMSPRSSRCGDDSGAAPSKETTDETSRNLIPRLADEASVTMEQIFDALGSQQQLTELLEKHVGKDKASFVDDPPLGGEYADAVRYNVENMYEFEEKEIAAMSRKRLRTRSLPRTFTQIDLDLGIDLKSPSARTCDADTDPRGFPRSQRSSFSISSSSPEIGSSSAPHQAASGSKHRPRSDPSEDPSADDEGGKSHSAPGYCDGSTIPGSATPPSTPPAIRPIARIKKTDAQRGGRTGRNEKSSRNWEGTGAVTNGMDSSPASSPRRGRVWVARTKSENNPPGSATKNHGQQHPHHKTSTLSSATVLTRMSYAEIVRLGNLAKSAKKKGASSSTARPQGVPALDLGATQTQTQRQEVLGTTGGTTRSGADRRPIDVSLPSSRRQSARVSRQSPSRQPGSSTTELEDGWQTVRINNSLTDRGPRAVSSTTTPPSAVQAHDNITRKQPNKRFSTSNGFDVLAQEGKSKSSRAKAPKAAKTVPNIDELSAHSPQSIQRDQETIGERNLKIPIIQKQISQNSRTSLSTMETPRTNQSLITPRSTLRPQPQPTNAGKLSPKKTVNNKITQQQNEKNPTISSKTTTSTTTRRKSMDYETAAAPLRRRPEQQMTPSTPTTTNKQRSPKEGKAPVVVHEQRTGIRIIDSFVGDLNHAIAVYTTPGASQKDVSKTPILIAGAFLFAIIALSSRMVVNALLS